MEEKTLTITLVYLQGKPLWERRLKLCIMNGEEVSYTEALSEFLKTNQPLLPNQEKNAG